MIRSGPEALRDGEQPDYSHALVRKILLEVGRRRGERDAEACSELFAWVETALSIRRHLLGRLAERGLSEAKFCALTVLMGAAPEPSTPSDLAYHAGVTRATMTEVLDQMVAAGWVSRSRSEGDRRQWVVTLTAAGRTLVDEAVTVLMAAAKELVEQLPAIAPRGRRSETSKGK